MDGPPALDPTSNVASSSAPLEPAPAPAPTTDSQQHHKQANGHHEQTAHDNDDRELPVVLQDLVPLSYLIDRVVSSAYSDLATLIETLPGTVPEDHQLKKRKIVDHVLHTRRQLVKLLVLTRWSAEAHRVHKAINIVAFLAIQNLAVDHAVDRLNETHQMLARARVRNYDLDSAIATLSTASSGPPTFPSLPASLTDPFQLESAAPLSDQEALATLSELNQVLLARLVLRLEPLPPPLADPSTWSIHDGRVTFTQPGLWEADMTYGGGNKEDEQGEEGREWYLLAVRFLFKVKDARGAWSAVPLGPIKDHLLDLCNRELLRRPYFPAPLPPRPVAASGADGTTSDVLAGADNDTAAKLAMLPDPQAPPPAPGEVPLLYPNGDASSEAKIKSEVEMWDEREREWKEERDRVKVKRKRDRPLERGYTFLQRLALSYQIEAIHSNAARLAATSWSGSLEIERRSASAATAPSAATGQSKSYEGADVEGEDEVRVHYWRPAPSNQPQNAPGKPLRPGPSPHPSSSNVGGAGAKDVPGRRFGPGGTIVFSLRPVATTNPTSATASSPSTSLSAAPSGKSGPSRRRGAARTAALQAALDAATDPVSSTSDSADLAPRSSPTQPVPSSLSVTWLPSLSLTSTTAPSALASVDLTSMLGSDLDVERILRFVTALHARETVARLAGVVVGASNATKKARLVVPPRPQGATSDEQEKEETRVPYLHLPLVGAHAIGAYVDPVTGRFELRAVAAQPLSDGQAAAAIVEGEDAAAAAADEGSPTTSRDQRLRLASERIDRERFAPTQGASGSQSAPGSQQKAVAQGGPGQVDPDGWMKGVVEVVARIRASTILDELDTLISLLSLPLVSAPVRRLPLPPRELAKLGPNSSASAGRAAFLFVPLLADEPALAGWFLLFELFEDGIRAALMSTAERSDQLGHWSEVLEVGWLGTGGQVGTNADRGGEASGKGANLGYEVKSETIRTLWWLCVRRASAFAIEQQLHLRRISYRREAVSGATASRLVIPSSALLRVPDLAQLLRPDAELRCAIEEDGRKRSILLVYLRLAAGQPSPLPPPSELPPSILFNPAKGALVLLTEGALGETVERLLRALATVVKIIRAARPIGSPVKTPGLAISREIKLEKR